jgi:hypothetical protein
MAWPEREARQREAILQQRWAPAGREWEHARHHLHPARDDAHRRGVQPVPGHR